MVVGGVGGMRSWGLVEIGVDDLNLSSDFLGPNELIICEVIIQKL